MGVDAEIVQIGDLIASAAFLIEVRREVQRTRSAGFVVTDGRRVGSRYDVVVRCGDGDGEVLRRIRGISHMDASRIANGVLGVNHSRRKVVKR